MKALVIWCLLAGACLAQQPLVLVTAGKMKNDPHYGLTADPVAKYLTEGLGRPVKVEGSEGYEDVLARLAKGDVDLAILPPIVNLQATDRKLSRPLAYGVYISGGWTYRAYVLARKGDGPQSLEELKGKKVGFVEKTSASGYVYPKCLLADHGLKPEDVTEVFTGGHIDSLKTLDDKKVDAAAVYELAFAGGIPQKLADYRVLGTTDPIPAEMIVATPRLSQADGEKVQDLLYAFHARRLQKPEWKEGRYIGFIPPDPFVLVGVRKAWERVSGAEAH